MNGKRLPLAAAAAVSLAPALFLAPARADQVTYTSTQSQANRLSIFHDYGMNAVGDTAGNIPGSSGSGLATSLLGGYASTDTAGSNRPYDLSVTPLAGYDSNPEASRLPRGGAFAGGELQAAYHFNDGPGDPVLGSPLQATFAYDAAGAFYEGQVQNAGTVQQTFAAQVRQSLFNDTIFVGGLIDDQFTMEHGAAFLDTFDLKPSVEFFFVPNASLDLNFDYTHLQYYFHALEPQQRPKADRNTFNAMIHLYPLPQQRGVTVEDAPDLLREYLRETVRCATVGYAHVWNIPSGRDYEYESNRLYFGLEGVQVPQTRNLSVDLEYAHEFQNFFNPNTEGPRVLAGGPLAHRRHDGLDVFTFRSNARLFDLPKERGTVAAHLQWDIVHDGSNITARHFNEYVISGGLTYQY